MQHIADTKEGSEEARAQRQPRVDSLAEDASSRAELLRIVPASTVCGALQANEDAVHWHQERSVLHDDLDWRHCDELQLSSRY